MHDATVNRYAASQLLQMSAQRMQQNAQINDFPPSDRHQLWDTNPPIELNPMSPPSFSQDAYSDTMLGYANSIRTVDGGTHIDGHKASLTTLNNLGKKSKLIKEKDISLSGEHVREGLTCVISVKHPDP